jgi:hypothetical protein
VENQSAAQPHKPTVKLAEEDDHTAKTNSFAKEDYHSKDSVTMERKSAVKIKLRDAS